MTYLKIELVQLKTVGGHDAQIKGIDPGSSDCFIGDLLAAHGGPAEWDIEGKCRNHGDDCNLDTNSDEFVEIDRIARAFVNEKFL